MRSAHPDLLHLIDRDAKLEKVYVVLKEGQTATEEEIIQYCRGRMANYKVPKFVEFRW